MKKLIILILLFAPINLYSQKDFNKSIYEEYVSNGQDAQENGDLKSAIEWFAKAADYTKDCLGKRHSLYGASLMYLVVAYVDVGDYDKAIDLGEKARQIDDKSDLAHTALLLKTLADCYTEKGNYIKVIEFGNDFLNVIKEVFGEYHINYVSVLIYQAERYRAIKDYSKAIELESHALGIVGELDGKADGQDSIKQTDLEKIFYRIVNDLASDCQKIGDYVSAIELREQILIWYEEKFGEYHLEYVTLLAAQAKDYITLGFYTKAIRLREKEMAIVLRLYGGGSSHYATALGHLASGYSAIGNYQRAIELQEQALKIENKVLEGKSLNDNNYAITLCNLAASFFYIGNYEKGIELGEQSLKIMQELNVMNSPQAAILLSNLAGCYGWSGDYAKAIELYKQALIIKKKLYGEHHFEYAVTLNNLAVQNLIIGNYATGEKLGKRTLSIMRNIFGESHPYYLSSLDDLIFQYFVCAKHRKITKLKPGQFAGFKQYVLTQLREMTSLERQTFWDENISDEIYFNSLSIQRLSKYKPCRELSYNSLLFTKGAMLATNVDFDKVILESGDMELLAKFEELRATRKILNTYYNKPIAERPKEEVERLEVLAGNLEKDLIAGSKEYADFTHRLTIEWREVRTALDRKDVAIEFLAADRHNEDTTPHYYAALVLRKGWNAPRYVDLCNAKELNAYVDGNNLGMIYQQQSQELYNLFWGKLEPYLKEGDNVYLSPDGALHQMNIEVLQDTDGRRANEKWNLHRVSSTRELCVEKERIDYSSAALYGGLTYDVDSVTMLAQSRAYTTTDDLIASRGFVMDSTMRAGWRELPGTKEEVDAIAKMCKSNKIHTDIYTTFAGNEESFKALSGKRTPIIHLATHGFFYKNEEIKRKPFFELQMDGALQAHKPNNSLKRSGLILAGAQKAWLGESIPDNVEDGILLAEEIAAMDLRGTDLVVLSACETGLGEITSEGVFGLQRAFKMAGVQTIIMSLWQVHDDATSLFMQTFYENLFNGMSKRDAFERAQQTMQQHKDYSDPYYWASFIMLD